MDGISELAKMFKERENKPYMGPQIGEVISPPPNIQVRLGGKIILTKDNLVIAAHVLNNYTRQFSIEGNISFSDSDCGTTDSVNDGGYEANSHSHTIETLNIDTTFNSNGTMAFTDTLKQGDKVILIPSTDEQIYFLIDKAVTL